MFPLISKTDRYLAYDAHDPAASLTQTHSSTQ